MATTCPRSRKTRAIRSFWPGVTRATTAPSSLSKQAATLLVVLRQLAGIQHDATLSEQPNLAGDRSRCATMITGDHRDLDASAATGSQCLSDIWSGRILEADQGEQA